MIYSMTTELDLFGILVLLLLYIDGKNEIYSNWSQKLFNLLTLDVIIFLFFDGTGEMFNTINTTQAKIFNYISVYLQYTSELFIGILLIAYTNYSLKHDNRYLNRILPIYLILGVVSITMLLLNPLVGWIFTITPKNVYVPGPAGDLLVIFQILYVIITSIVLSFKIRKYPRFQKKAFWYLIWTPLLIIPSFILQRNVMDVPFSELTFVFVIFLIYINIQNRRIRIDALTGLNNRFRFNDYLLNRVTQLQTGEQLYTMVIDLDNFKVINTDFGQTIGDDALIHVANILKGLSYHKNYFLARLSGDKFIFVLVYKNNGELLISNFIDQVKQGIKESNEDVSIPYSLSPSFGWSKYNPNQKHPIDDLMFRTEAAIDAAKKRKKVTT